jgi:hypothetical protein
MLVAIDFRYGGGSPVIMPNMESAEDKARAIFGQREAFYTTSTSHTDPQVLQKIVSLAAPQLHRNALDFAA